MTARQPISSPATRAHATAWVDAIAQIKRASGPKTGGYEGEREDALLPDDVRAAARLLAAHRRRAPRKLSALDRLIVDYLRELPDIGPAAIWGDLKRIAEDGGNTVVVEFDQEAGVLSWSPSPGGAIREICFEAFRKKVQRVRLRH